MPNGVLSETTKFSPKGLSIDHGFLTKCSNRTHLTLTYPYMRNFKIAQFLEKCLTIDYGFFGVLGRN